MKMQKLYSITYPCKDVAKADELYFRGKKCAIDPSTKKVVIPIGQSLNTCTYYNTFSLEKWSKYTSLSSLYLKLKIEGNCRIDIYTKYLIAGDYLDKQLETVVRTDKQHEDLILNLSPYISLPGLLYFEVTALDSQCAFFSGEYLTDEDFNLPNIGIVICTYKREPYIKKFIENFALSECSQNLYAFIADNGNSLPTELNNDRIFIFKNKNYGGAGGFTRGMLEIKKYNKMSDSSIQYILLMDDDIVIDFHIFERLTSFIALKKPGYENYFIAGGMCSLDYPFLQYERSASWRGNQFIQLGANLDLRETNAIVLNEREDQLKHCSAGWWFSCFSEKMITPNNYPFPCFFRGDDMEFTIRNGANIITMNGLNVWHEPFYKKYSIVSESYYLYRNSLVINALYLPEFGFKATIQYLFKRFAVNLVTYDYESAALLLRAWRDYCKGMDFFLTTNPEELNTELYKFNHKLQPISEVIPEYRFIDIESDIYRKADKNKWHSFIRHITINGFLIPKCFYHSFDFALVGFGARYINFYKVKNVFNFDPFSKKGYYTHVSKKKAIHLILQFIQQTFYYRKNFNKIQSDYQRNFHKIQTEEFWKRYLDIQ